MKVQIYSTPFCGYCKLLKQYLDEKSVAYEEFDVSSDIKRQEEMIAKTNQQGVPVTIITKESSDKDNKDSEKKSDENKKADETIIIGFDKNKIDEVLNIN